MIVFLYSSCCIKYANVLIPFFSIRNIFQDVAHRDTLVKSFIDEVSFHIIQVIVVVFVILKAEKQAGCNRAVPHTRKVDVCRSDESAIDT